jgi:hypothetical protein
MGRAGRRWAVLIAVLTATLVAGAPAATAEVSSADIVRLLSLQREANGIPGALLERTDWSTACAKHNYYEAQTGQFGHSEDSSSPYYSVEGDWAAHNSVLAAGSAWSEGNPWEDAPIHLIQMLAPQLSEMGAAENEHHNCATTWPGYQRPSPPSPAAYSYPGNGVAGVVPTEYAAESPFIPGDFVGLPEGTATGRYLLAYLEGVPDSEAWEVTATATLASATGPVDLRVVDSTNPDIGGYMPHPSAFLIPAQPLKPQTGYEARVAWSVAGAPLFDQRFSFTTGADPATGPLATKRGRTNCNYYSRQAKSLYKHARQARRRGAHLRAVASSKSARKRGARLLARSLRLKHQARHRARQAKRCRAAQG